MNRTKGKTEWLSYMMTFLLRCVFQGVLNSIKQRHKSLVIQPASVKGNPRISHTVPFSTGEASSSSPEIISKRKRSTLSILFCHNFGSMFALSCSPVTHTSPVSVLWISARIIASLLPAWINSQVILASFPTGTGRRNVILSERLTPGRTQKSGRLMPMRTEVVRISIRVVAQPPWRAPFILQCSGLTMKR